MTKSIFFSVLLMFLSSALFAQLFKKLRAGVWLGMSDGVVAAFEPGYRVLDQVLVGARFEEKFFIGKQTSSLGINAQYYFSNEGLRPFLGLGLSKYYTQISGGPFYNYSSREEEAVWGFYPRTGFDAGRFLLAIEWNIIPAANATISSSTTSTSGYVNGSYVSVKVGLAIGGGRREIFY